MTEEYAKVIDLVETYDLMYTEEMMNVMGVMYANGFYYEQNYEKAIQYFKAAAEYGERDETFLNLWLASYEADKAIDDELFPYDNTYEAVLVGQKKNNIKLCEFLKSNAQIYSNEGVEDGYEFINQMSEDERNDFFDIFSISMGEHSYRVCTAYDYYIDENGGLFAVPRCIEERRIETRINVKGNPSEYVVFDDMNVPVYSSEESEVVNVYEFETSYIDDNGDMRLL